MLSSLINSDMDRTQINKIALILLFCSITVPIIFFNQTLDEFVPKHIAQIIDVLANGGLVPSSDMVSQVPGFYFLGSIIVLITGFPPESLMTLPIQLVPYLVLLFYLLYRIGGNAILAASVTFIDLCSGVTGTGKIFFWPHGIGTILFFLIVILVLDSFKDTRRKRATFLNMVTGASLVYLSYNFTAMSLILLISIGLASALVYLALPRLKHADPAYFSISKTALITSIVLFCVEMGLSKFTYGVFIPMMRALEYIDVGGLEKFIISYLNPDLSAVFLSPIMVHFPASITVISAIKYGLLALTLLGFVVVVGKGLRQRSTIEDVDIVLIAVLVMQGIYSIARLLIGGVIATAVWLPGILSLARLPQRSKIARIWSTAVIAVLLVLTLSIYGILFAGGLIDRIDYSTDGYMESGQWINENTDSRLLVSDELTKNFKLLFDTQKANHGHTLVTSHNDVANNSLLMSLTEAGTVADLKDGNLNRNSYYALNTRVSRLSLENWIVIQSWRLSDDVVAANTKVNKVYENRVLSVYYPS